ncbi:phosphatidylcholine transfer protein-like [Corticium candelabrum]|uniref:phosphatidylcholine transfer protein-like n=1 Tax=Corticium candelabrum TaxID=121492 RepID=UPI002E26271B|nr:phosphatidylcholine transfer protein-like [Corticium candelabrum]
MARNAPVIPAQFTSEQFGSAVSELENPDLDGYNLLTESHGMKIYSRRRDSGLYEYKVYGSFPCFSPELCSQVYNDLEYRNTWDTYVVQLTELEDVKIERGVVIYWCVKYPFPLSNRDYVFVRETRELESSKGVCSWAALSASLSLESQPERSRVVRVNDFQQCVVLQSDGANGSLVYMHYYDDPKGMIPKWLINWAAQTAVPMFLKTMNDAFSKYTVYQSSKSK